MFSGFMVDTWEAASVVAVVAGLAGFFVVARGSAFAAHALPSGAFAGAAGASLLGVSTTLGLGVFSVAGAAAIAALGRQARRDVAAALAIVAMLATGSLFLALGNGYAGEVDSLLFGQVLGVSSAQVEVTAALGAASLALLVVSWRRVLWSSVLPEAAAARGVSPGAADASFLAVLALVTATAVPVVGALLVFSLLVAPPAAARQLAGRPGSAALLGTALALATVWSSVALSYEENLPVGFVVGALGALLYATARLSAGRRGRARRSGCG